MPTWNYILIIFAVLGHMASSANPDVKITSLSELFVFGLFPLVSHLLAHLWWVAILVTALRIGFSIGRPLSALALCIGLGFGGLWALMGAIDEGRFAPVVTAEEGVGQLPITLEMQVLGQGTDPDCAGFCRQLLAGGGVLWLTQSGDTLVYFRADTAACRALDPAFESGTPCLLARRAAGEAADLALVQKAIDRESMDYLMGGTMHALLWDRRVDPLPVYTPEERWNEVLRLLGPAGTPGPKPRRVPHQVAEGWVNLEAVARRAGLPLQEDRFEIDATLVLSVLQAMGRDPLTPGQFAMVREWLRNASYAWLDAAPSGIDHEVLLLLRPLPELAREPWSHLGLDASP